MEVKIRYDVSSKVIRKVDGIFPMSSESMYACLLKLRMWAYSGSVISAFRVDILEHSLTLFLLKIFSNSELGITGATFGRIILWAGVNIGLKFSVLLLTVIVVCRFVRRSTVSFLSRYAQIRLFEILEMYLTDLGPISFFIAGRLVSSIAWMMIAWSFVGYVSSCAAWEYDLMELFLSVWLENWEPLYSKVPAGWCGSVGVFIPVVFLCIDVRNWCLFSLTLTL